MDAPENPREPTPRQGLIALCVLGLAFHLPRLFRPLSDIDACAGPYFGVFFRNYEAYGFWNLRGMSLWRQLFPAPEMAEPYLTHPPGLWWTMYALGGDEWAMRAPTIVGAILAACCLYLIVRPKLGAWPALVAGALLLGGPAMAVYCQLSYEPVSTGIGLLMCLSTLRVMEASDAARQKWRIVQVASAFVGTWMDWSFGMYCFALVPLTASSNVRTWFSRLLPPGIATVVAVSTVIAWQKWALASPSVTAPPDAGGVVQQFRENVLTRPDTGEYLRKIAHWMRHSMGIPMLATALLGVAVFFQRSPRLTMTLLVGGASHWLLFAGHALGHPHFFCLTTPFVAASAAALWTGLASRAPRAGVFVIAAITVTTWLITYAHDRRTDSSFQRDLGAAINDAARVRDAEGQPTDEKIGVMTNFAPVWAAYVDEPTAFVVYPITDVAALESVRRDRPYRYVHLTVEKPPGVPWNDPDPVLAAWLEQFPKRELRGLEQHIYDAGYGWDWNVTGAAVYEVPRALAQLAASTAFELFDLGRTRLATLRTSGEGGELESSDDPTNSNPGWPDRPFSATRDPGTGVYIARVERTELTLRFFHDRSWTALQGDDVIARGTYSVKP